MTMDGRKLMIGMPSGDDVKALTQNCFDGLVRRHGSYTAHLIGTYVERNQNLIVQPVLALPAIEYIMFIDSDMIFPDTIVDQLASRKVDIVGCSYRSRQVPHEHMVTTLENTRPTGTEIGLKEVAAVPSGMMLVRRRVFETIPYPWFFNFYGDRPEDFVGNDVNFCRKARQTGFKIWCDYFASRDIYHYGGCAIGWSGVQ